MMPCPRTAPCSYLLHDGLLWVLALNDTWFHVVTHRLVTLAPSQDAEAGRGTRMVQPLLNAGEGLGQVMGASERAPPHLVLTPKYLS